MVINFRETVAGSIATAVKNKTAEENAYLGPEVSKMIVKDLGNPALSNQRCSSFGGGGHKE